MTITDVIEMARKAGGHDGFTSPPTDWVEGDFVISPEALLKFATLVRNAVLEEAAWVCIETGSTKGSCDAAFDMADACAAAIRAMKEQASSTPD